MKIKLVVASLLAVSLSSTAVFADLDPKFYVGGEAQFNKFKLNKKLDNDLKEVNGKGIKKSSPGAGFFVGSRLNEYVGVEAGASANRALHKKYNTFYDTVKIKNNNFYADALGYIPVTCDVDLIGSVGVGKLTSTGRNFEGNNERTRSSKVGVRAGAGLQYKFDENVGARLMVRYQKGNKIIKNTTQAGLGLFYQF